jgi:hypothetical protein
MKRPQKVRHLWGHFILVASYIIQGYIFYACSFLALIYQPGFCTRFLLLCISISGIGNR